MFEASKTKTKSVKFGFAHIKQFHHHVEDFLHISEDTALNTTQLRCERHTDLEIINSTYKEGVW